ncbi:MAG: pitrilysin family protein [Microscillaceae bacterium]
MIQDIYIATLPNGVRLVHKYLPHTRIAHCGFVLDIGSRDEAPHQQGIAHFWEHMAFKGTHKRKAFHIINRLESLGGELNAYTTKEKICFYASFLDTHYEKAVELLSDITFDSVFPENQIERERNVILEEMAMYLDSPDDAIQDDFDSLVFEGHPLGANILGTAESVQSFHRQDFRAFMQENLNTEKVVFASLGNLSFDKVKRLAEKYIGPVPPQKASQQRQPFLNFTPKSRQKPYSASQAHCAIGTTAYALHHPRRLVFFLVNNLLGGPGLNSRLNLELREKKGYVYSVESTYQPFLDTGLFAVYFATEPRHLQKSQQLILKNFRQLCTQKLGTLQLHQAKAQLLGQLAMAEENNLSFMLMMGKSLLNLGYIEPLEEIFAAIHQISAEDVLDVANEILSAERLCTLVYHPESE